MPPLHTRPRISLGPSLQPVESAIFFDSAKCSRSKTELALMRGRIVHYFGKFWNSATVGRELSLNLLKVSA